jgi:hypothetical protein
MEDVEIMEFINHISFVLISKNGRNKVNVAMLVREFRDK